MIQRWYLDVGERKTRIFSMARLEYDSEKKAYKAIDDRFFQFGDTAVVITNPAEFYRRLKDYYYQVYQDGYVVKVGEIIYKDLSCDYGKCTLCKGEKVCMAAGSANYGKTSPKVTEFSYR